MRAAALGAIIAVVLVRRARVDLSLDLTGIPITGELTVVGGRPRPFTGYAGLIAALEAIRHDAGVEPAGPDAAREERP